MELAPNTVIAGRFRLESLLGRGGMGSVWRATHLGLDVPCAVKFIDEQHASSPELRARFEREAKAAAVLRSPHVVQILDHGVFQETPYIAMELLEGEDLRARLKVRGRLAPREVVVVIDQIARALARAHTAGIVHRDLKPENVFLVRDEDREIAKVLDFGIAKAQDASSVSSHTRTGALLGTPYYMSPEQASGNKAVDWRSDLWSVAVMTYELMTGRKPFESDGLGDLLMQLITAPLPMPSQIAPVPPGFDAWWARAAERPPERRFQSAKELVDALRAVVEAPGGWVPAPAPFAGTPMPGDGRINTNRSVSTASPVAHTLGTSTRGQSAGSSRTPIIAGVAIAVAGALCVSAVGAWQILRHPRAADTSAAVAPPQAVTALPPAATSSPAQAQAAGATNPAPAADPAAAPTPAAATTTSKPTPTTAPPAAQPRPAAAPPATPAAPPRTPAPQPPPRPAGPVDRTGF